MTVRRYLCKHCWYVFDLASAESPPANLEIRCPACSHADIMEAPAWAPLGSGQNIFEGTAWKYECQQCRKAFELPIPRNPAEDKGRRCPACGSGHLHLLTGAKALPLYCG